MLKRILFLCTFCSLIFMSCEEDLCEASNCQNGGICNETTGNCDCPTGFEGLECETAIVDPCENVNCQNGGTCNEQGQCQCPLGFEGINCETASACVDVNCYNGGVCVDGTCDCPEGFTGPDCGTSVSTLFFGNWSAADNCSSIGGFTYDATILETSTGGDILNFSGFGVTTGVPATIAGNTISFSYTDLSGAVGYSLIVNGSGTISDDGNTINWTYDTETMSTTETCTGVWTYVP